jgi:hypothetical protein
MFRETLVAYCENDAQRANTLCGLSAEFLYVEAGGIYSNHWALKALSVNGDELFLNGSNERILHPPHTRRGKRI